MTKSTYDVAVIGGGPGGYVAGIRAAQLGQDVVLVERDQLGGVCLNWGCIPTKALLHAADVLRQVNDASRHGVAVGPAHADLPAMVKRSRAVAAQLNKGVTHLLKKNRVTVLAGRGELQGSQRVGVTGPNGVQTTLEAASIVLATGARPRPVEGLAPDGKTVWTYRDALMPPLRPGRLLVVGAGAIGVEFASFYHAIGVKVDLVEMSSRILPSEDEEVSAQVADSLRKQGIRVFTGARIRSAAQRGAGWHVVLDDSHATALDTDAILVAAGIVGNVEGLGLERTAAQVEKTHIVTDSLGRTAEPGLYAIGDVAGAPWLAHKASHEGVLVAELIAGRSPHPLRTDRIPACTYSHPQVASIGLTEAQAREAGHRLRVGKFPFAANGKAIARGSTLGFSKVVFDADSGELLGAHLVGDEVTEMIQGFAIAKTLETSEADLMATVFPHPTMSESMHESVLAAWEQALHI